MTDDEILALIKAHMVNVGEVHHGKPDHQWWCLQSAAIELCRAVAAHEREEAAKVCDSVNNYDNPMTARDCADAIRSRT